MTSTSRKLDSFAKNAEICGTFIELLAVLKRLANDDGYTIEAPEPHMVSLSRDGLTKIFLSTEVWSAPLRAKPFFEAIGADGICVICVGEEAELKTLPALTANPYALQLALPITASAIATSLRSIHNMQANLREVDAERHAVQKAAEQVKYVLSISRELNGERDIPRLLSLILSKAREAASADAGSIYVVDSPTNDVRDGVIHFKITQNHSIVQNLSEFKIPVNDNSIVGNAVIHGTAINFPDLYKLSPNPAENPFGAIHDRSWDRRTGYETHSMLTVPMFDISHRVVGVIQLINRKRDPAKVLVTQRDFEEQVLPFDEHDVEYTQIVAQQAGIALENATLAQEIKNLFEGFVHASVTAIEQRDPTTSGHSHRVATLTVELAKVVDRIDAGPLATVAFTADQLKEIEYASLLHDFGKLGVSERVLVKAKKLYPWQFDLLMERFELIRASFEIDYLRHCINFLQAPNLYPLGLSAEQFARDRDAKLRELDDFVAFIRKANEPTVLEQGGFERLNDIANLTFADTRGRERPFLLTDELTALSVSRGSLTSEEFAEIQSHVTHTYDFLRKIPWGKALANVPQIAAKHHEKLDGTGYPLSAGGEQIPVQSRMMTIADIFDALTASDRPYKRAVPVEKALDILTMEVKGGKVDAELFKVFFESGVFKIVIDK